LKIAVVILNHNGEKLLPQFLPSVIECSKEATVFVADNGSTDSSLKILEKDFNQVRLIKLDKNYGFCGGYNRALKQIQAEYYILLNSDVEVTQEWLTPMVELMESQKEIAAIQPKILSWHQKEYFEYAGAGGGFIDWLGYPFCRGRLFDFVEKDEDQYNDTREVFWATGACLMVRSSVYHELGGLDEDFFAHMEEIDLCWRIQRAGFKVFYCGQSTVYHVGAGTLSRQNPRKTYLNFRNGIWLLYKNLSFSNLMVKLPLRIAFDNLAAIRFLVMGQFKDFRAVWLAYVHCIKGLPKLYKKRKALQKYPYSNRNIYSGITPWQYFLLRKKKITIPSTY
jgi:GT2 family glycosyltransferase